MKNAKKIPSLLLLFILLITIASCNNSDDNDFELSNFIIENYTNDARLLYMNEIFNDVNHPNYDNTALDETEIKSILKVIQAVYNLNIPETDTIFNQNVIQPYLCYSFDSLSLKVDTNASEIVNLVNEIIPTGNVDLDNILELYTFDNVDTAFSYPSFPFLTLKFSGNYNMIPIRDELLEVSSILISEISSLCVGDGNSIALIRENDDAIITFSIGSGDCPSGCIYHRYWEFRVINNEAEFVRVYEN